MVAWRTFNIWRTFLFHKRLFVVKEGSSDYKKVERDGSLKKPLTEWFFFGTKNGYYIALLWRTFWAPFIFKSVCMYVC